MTKIRTLQSLSRLLIATKSRKMKVKELKSFLKISRDDSIVYKRNDEVVEPNDTDTVVSISATGDWNGFVQYNVELG